MSKIFFIIFENTAVSTQLSLGCLKCHSILARLPRSPSPHRQRTWSWRSAVARSANNISLWYLEQGQPRLMCLCLGAVEPCTGAQASPDGANKERNKKCT